MAGVCCGGFAGVARYQVLGIILIPSEDVGFSVGGVTIPIVQIFRYIRRHGNISHNTVFRDAEQMSRLDPNCSADGNPWRLVSGELTRIKQCLWQSGVGVIAYGFLSSAAGMGLA